MVLSLSHQIFQNILWIFKNSNQFISLHLPYLSMKQNAHFKKNLVFEKAAKLASLAVAVS